ncbi:MAG: hypothetical protein IPP66_10415 [Anaerolineales bacterium]|nr:hypothetical protein [Anaerolineales bacterium]
MTNKASFLILIVILTLAGCNFSSPVSPTPTQTLVLEPIRAETQSPVPLQTFTPIPTFTATVVPTVAQSVCTDPAVVTLIDSLKRSILTADGTLLSSLVSPNGMEVRYFRMGNAVKYLPEQAQFLFETTYEADWGSDPASGMEKKGSFHDVVVPELVKAFNQSYTLHCNELKHGGATYSLEWPYEKDFYSIYFAGTEVNGFLDWHTWAVGVEYVNGKPVIYALTQFYWEP